ncbi:TrmB family transcriptional regulator sugar-binding domain-containing protein [Halalkalicoccus sp. NIPERK01]|uniref:TrmB family transcriptional regulator sugar-binding domain-containing protein n=1 Tax=Halalkalicoccus sp. NIPERK01 TaxID=3053469 RepID=UPI00256F4433|nr:TrmB family transcriptional regulator sugar-binding domain-containing protein [Halalkalicoccus sp. NIPERK01]MDL5363371.1 TrmB family transcriptional regulator sugar-binding domain-containing protein [Halalkalicoccus sp. NIPERK01]
MSGSRPSLGRTDLRATLEENVGMSHSEAEVYLTLIRYGKQTMTEIAQNCDVPKQRVYNVVDDLRDEGFVEIIDDYPQQAYAIDPTETIDPLVNRLRDAEDELKELYQTIEGIHGGVNLFKSRASIKKHVRNVITEANESVFMLAPLGEIETFREDLAACTDVRTQLVVSNLDDEHINGDTVELPTRIVDDVDRVRGIKSNESMVVTSDRREAFFWTDTSTTSMATQEQGFRITNPELAFLLDRFLDVSIWSLAKPVRGAEEDVTFPKRYLRMRDCLADLKKVTQSRPVESFEVEFESYGTETSEPVVKRGVVTGYYYSPFDVRAYLELDIDDEPGTKTVGGWKATLEDYGSRRLTVYERETRQPSQSMDEETAEYLATCLASLPDELADSEVTFGFDGMVDNVRQMVDERHGPDEYDRLDHLEELGDRIRTSAASDTSFTNEWLQVGTRCGGHAAHLSRAFGTLGHTPTLIGAFGQPIHEKFREEFGEYELHSFGEPTITDAVEFNDGKLMLQETGSLSTVDWDHICSEVGVETVAETVDGTDLLGLGYWAFLPMMPTIWDGLRTDLWPLLSDPPNSVFIDPADIRQLSREHLRDGLTSLRRLDETVPVTFSANRGETMALANLSASEDQERSLRSAATVAREQLGVSRFVGHSPVESVLVDGDETFRTDIPRTTDPIMTTSAGDHFNAGLILAQLNGLAGGEQLILGNALAGWFVRNGDPPTYDQLRTFVDTYDIKFN